MDTTFSRLFYRWHCLLCPSGINNLSDLYSCASGTGAAVDRLCPLQIWHQTLKGRLHGGGCSSVCFFKLSSFPWDGANIQTVLQLVNWADFVGLDSNMRSCLNRLYLILFFSVLLLSCHQKWYLFLGREHFIAQQHQSHALSWKALLAHWEGSEVLSCHSCLLRLWDWRWNVPNSSLTSVCFNTTTEFLCSPPGMHLNLLTICRGLLLWPGPFMELFVVSFT